jgi:HD-GYP domain-containing protein (c-di-GMP phosphodiesterase class II)
MTTESRAPQAADWADVVEALHGALTIITVRGQYPPGHPAVRRADEQAAAGFARVFKRVSEVVVALIDNEFIVSERPRPELRERLPGLADVMVRHDVECFVFQQGITVAECSSFAEILSTPPDPDEPARAREQAHARLQHILLRFAELKAQDGSKGHGGVVEYVVPAVHEALADLARGIARGRVIDTRTIRAVAESIQSKCALRTFAIEPRAYAPGKGDLAAHAANVATMTAVMADEAGFPARVCVELTAAALVHDVGRLLLPSSIRDTPEPLLDERAKKEFRHHPLLGARALLAGGCSALWVAVALEHHRGVDGGGYPVFGSKAAPHALVRIVSLANYFDDKRATVDGRVESPPDVLRAASALEKRYFDRRTLELFLRTLGAFPPGTVVELSDRRAAVATRANPGDPLRPEVSVLFGPDSGKRIDLKALNASERKHEVSIVRAIAPPLSLYSETATARPEVQAMSVLPDLSAMSLEAKSIPVPPKDSSAPRARIPSEPSLGPGRIVSALPPAAGLPISPVTPLPPAPASARPIPASVPASARAAVRASANSVPVVRPGAYSSQPAALASPPSARPSVRASRPAAPPSLGVKLDLDRVPKVLLAMSAIMKLPLDPRAGFLLSLMDGVSTLETIVDTSGLPREEVLHIVGELIRQGAVALA